MARIRKSENILAKNALFSILYRMMNVIFPLISAAYLARVLAPSGIGRVAYAQNIVSYFLMIAVLGIPYYGTRELAKVRENRSASNKLFSELLSINFIATAACIAVYYPLVWALFPGEILLYAVVGLDLVFNFFNIDWFYQGREEYGYITLRSFLVKVLSLLGLFLFVREREDYVIYALIHCFGTGCNYLLNVMHARKLVRFSLQGMNLRQHVLPIMTLLASTIAASLYNKIDVTMLGVMASEASVGYYVNAHKVVSIVLTLVTAISAVFLPRLSHVYQNDRQKFGEYLSLGVKVVLILALPSCLGLILVAENLTGVMFGGEFLPAASTMQILAVFTIIKGLGDLLCYQAIISTGKEKVLIKSRIIASVTNIILNALLIPRYGHNGAAAASVISEIIVNGMVLPYGLSIVRLDIAKRFFISIAISAFGMVLAVLGIQHVVNGYVASLVLSVAAGVAVYGGMLLLTKNDLVTMLLGRLHREKQ